MTSTNSLHLKTLLVALLVLGAWCLSTGMTDLDWMVVSYRYSEWHRTQEQWEFCPFLKMNWWLAYMVSLGRIVLGTACITIVAVVIAREMAK